MASLTNAPLDQLIAARAAYAKLKKLAAAKGIDFARVYTSFNTRTAKVRVKVFAVSRVGNNMAKCEALGFTHHRGSRFGGYSSLVGHF